MDAQGRRKRGVIADTLLGAGATLVLLESTAARNAWVITAGILTILTGAALLWGVPRPTLRLRMIASIAGLLLGFALVTAQEGGGSFIAFLTGIALLVGSLHIAGRHRVVRRGKS